MKILIISIFLAYCLPFINSQQASSSSESSEKLSKAPSNPLTYYSEAIDSSLSSEIYPFKSSEQQKRVLGPVYKEDENILLSKFQDSNYNGPVFDSYLSAVLDLQTQYKLFIPIILVTALLFHIKRRAVKIIVKDKIKKGYNIAGVLLSIYIGIQIIALKDLMTQYVTSVSEGSADTVRLSQVFVEGSKDDDWSGLSNISDVAKYLQKKVDNFASITYKFDEDLKDADEYRTQALQILEKTFKENKSFRLTRPDPNTDMSYVTGYSSNMGPTTDNRTYFGQIALELNSNYGLVNGSLANANLGIKTIKEGTMDVKVQLEQVIRGSERAKSEFLASVDDSINKVKHNVVPLMENNYYIGLSILAFSCIMSSSLLKSCTHSKFLWKILLILILVEITWMICYLEDFEKNSTVWEDSCELVDVSLKDPILFQRALDELYMNKTANRLPNDIVYDCVHNQGQELLKMFGILDALYPFHQVLHSNRRAVEFLSYPDSKNIPHQLYLLSNTRKGYFYESGQVVTDLKVLNDITNGNGECPNLKDTWVLNSVNCTQGTALLETDSSTARAGTPCCIGLDIWTSSHKSINERYEISRFSACTGRMQSNMQMYLIEFIERFQKNRKELVEICEKLEAKLYEIDQPLKLMNTALKSKARQFEKLNQNIKAIFGSFEADSNIPGYNCTSVTRKSFAQIQTSCTKVASITKKLFSLNVFVVLALLGLLVISFLISVMYDDVVSLEDMPRIQLPETELEMEAPKSVDDREDSKDLQFKY